MDTTQQDTSNTSSNINTLILKLKKKNWKKIFPFAVIGLILLVLPIVLFQVGQLQDLRQRAVSENAPVTTPRVAVIMMYFDYPSPTPLLTPWPTKPQPLTPYPTAPPPLTAYPTNIPVDPKTNSMLTKGVLKEILEGTSYNGQISVNAFYKDVTSEKIQFKFDYFDWTPIHLPSPSGCGEIYSLMETSDALLKAKGIDLSPYQMRMYAFSPLLECPYGGFGGKQPEKEYSFAFMNESTSPMIYSHELGHALKLGHANALTCSIPNDYTNNCVNSEYGDPYDVMGGSGYFNGPHQIGLGLLLPDQIQSITTSGRYSIVPINLKTSKKQVLKILKKDAPPNPCYTPTTGCGDLNSYYYVEYRRIVGADDNNSYYQSEQFGNTEGLIIHLWGGPASEYSPTYLLNTDLKKLGDGQPFYDKINNIKITLVSHNETEAVIDVQIGSTSLTPFPTTTSTTPTPTKPLIITPVISQKPTLTPSITTTPTLVIKPTSTNSPTPTKYASPTPTKTPTPTSIPTATPTIAPNHTVLNLALILPGIGPKTTSNNDNPNPIQKNRTATLRIYDASNKLIKTASGNVTFDNKYSGRFDLGSDFKSGNYTITVALNNTLFKKIPNIVSITSSQTNITPYEVKLSSGDLNQNNRLDVQDYSAFIACYRNLISCSPELKKLADFNDNGELDIFDNAIIVNGFLNIEGN